MRLTAFHTSQLNQRTNERMPCVVLSLPDLAQLLLRCLIAMPRVVHERLGSLDVFAHDVSELLSLLLEPHGLALLAEGLAVREEGGVLVSRFLLLLGRCHLAAAVTIRLVAGDCRGCC